MEKQLAEEDFENNKMRRRAFWLVPFNLLVILGTIKYARNINGIAAKYWPGRQRATLTNVSLAGFGTCLFISF